MPNPFYSGLAARATAQGISPQPRLDPVALIGLPGHIAGLYAACGSPALLLLAWLVMASAYLGRRAAVRVGGSLVPGNLHVGVADWPAAQSVARVLCEFFAPFNPQPVEVRSGVRDAHSLVFLVRDAVHRAEKVFTEREATPRYEVAGVDRGTEERRLLLTQALRSLLDRRSAAGDSLGAALMSSYLGEVPAVFVAAGGAVGYHLRATGAHIAVLTDVGPPRLPSAVFLPRLDSGLPTPFDVGTAANLDALVDSQLAFEAALVHPFPPDVPLEGSAEDILNAAVDGLAASCPLAAVKLAKISLLYCLADSGDIITADHARAAAAVLKHSAAVQEWSENQVQQNRLAARICGALAAAPTGLTTSEIGRKLHTPAAALNTALAVLLAAGRIARTVLPTAGRSCTVWTGR